ncbi:uncharacterized protein YgbK (DUF1537 family) [Pseudorhizobium tarimense]|uniref:Uncharacterized protein YgbK (DUF1537 family) n=1 Tax=Pseudorhizobium tarimense TaxID=1079109 RepID=A0ABV2H793_9HYPH|nr:four-carbon acid sugar kinase family protein [Pseudorhizobium tarimense]MCJ8519742.1 four-carbon acid sugar kinase family protein [Pseudorhizobium tarimense]
MTSLDAPECVYIGDDFTGASDTLATFSKGGARTKLFLQPPTATEMADLGAVGIATGLRSMAPRRMQEELERIMAPLAASRARFFHYKVCSTFDSSPKIGSIGAAVAAISAHIHPALVLIIGGQPSLGRYCCFGHLFAGASDRSVHRIDRHPVMSRHPVTPMRESDLRLHLTEQGLADIALVAATEIDQGAPAIIERLSAAAVSGAPCFLFDAVCQDHISMLAEVLRGLSVERPVLLVGASSVAEALTANDGSSAATMQVDKPDAGSGLPTFIFAGSRSSVTQSQVEAARLFKKLPLTPQVMSDPKLLQSAVEEARRHLSTGANLLAHLLPEEDYGLSNDDLTERSARFVAAVASEIHLSGLGIAGGDTSSAAVVCLGVRSLSYLGDADRGVAICSAETADGPLMLMLKGGQMGNTDLFDRFAGARL